MILNKKIIMKYIVSSIVLPIFIASISGCSLFKSDDPYAYRNAKSGKALEMPEGMAMPDTLQRQRDVIPESPSASAVPVEKLELPPEIIKSVDLKELDAREESRADTQAGGEKDTLAKKQVLTITVTKNTSGDSLLMVDEEFDGVWPQVRPALEALGFTIDDSSRGRELYAISKTLPAFELPDEPIHPGDEKPEVKEEFQIHVKPSDSKTQITVHNKFGQLDGSGLADHLLLQIKELMENPKSESGSDN